MGGFCRGSWQGAMPVLALLGALGACTAGDIPPTEAARPLLRPSWGTMVPANPEGAGTTVARVRLAQVPDAVLEPEPGNVWPAEEAPRATLANPDAALRGIPEYRGPGGGTPPPLDPRESARPDPAASRVARGSSSPPPPPPLPFDPDRPRAAIPPPPPPINSGRVDGRVLATPQGPAVTTGGTTRTQSYLGPSGTPGVAQSSGGVTTLFGADGTIQQVPTPR